MATRLNSPDQRGVLHYLTLCVRDRKRPFIREAYARMALEQLRFECDRHPGVVVAYVAMPDHIHSIVGLQDGAVSRFLSRYKPNVTNNLDRIAIEHGRVADRRWLMSKGKRELWQDSKHSLPLYSKKWIEQKIEYVHQNPVRAGLVEVSTDYLWSSVLAYHSDLQKPSPVPVDLNWEFVMDGWR